ncbi:hypothetical protein UJ101_01382 [Flavobacteriaceae bacterium UJ101]|nr:hypothetical protein UJ101_01382 [Flavobacteriaceae bacterium UJ101]
MKKLIISAGVLTSLFINSCNSDDGNCGRLGCLPNPVVNRAIQNTGSSVITTTGGIDGIIVYQVGTTLRAYDMQDPDKCTGEINSRLTLSDDQLSLISDSGEQFLLLNGQPTRGVSCRGLIQYNISATGQIFEVSN